MKTSRKHLDALVADIAKLQGRPAECWVRNADGTLKSNQGALHLNYASCYGGFDLVEICNTAGGESSLIGNTFCGRGRLKAHEMETFLLGMIAAIEGTHYWPRTKA